MKGIHINCPSCKKPLFKNTYMRIGSYLTCKCFYCGIQLNVTAEPNTIRIKIIGEAVDKLEKHDLLDDEEDDIMMIHL